MARSRNRCCCRGKEINNIYLCVRPWVSSCVGVGATKRACVCVRVALIILCEAVLLSAASLAVPHFWTLSYKRRDFLEKSRRT